MLFTLFAIPSYSWMAEFFAFYTLFVLCRYAFVGVVYDGLALFSGCNGTIKLKN